MLHPFADRTLHLTVIRTCGLLLICSGGCLLAQLRQLAAKLLGFRLQRINLFQRRRRQSASPSARLFCNASSCGSAKSPDVPIPWREPLRTRFRGVVPYCTPSVDLVVHAQGCGFRSADRPTLLRSSLERSSVATANLLPGRRVPSDGRYPRAATTTSLLLTATIRSSV